MTSHRQARRCPRDLQLFLQDDGMRAIVLVPVAMIFLLFGIGFVLHAKEKFYVIVLGLLLFGYMLFGKGIAYLGIAPLYVSEITLAIGLGTVALLAITRGRLNVVALRQPSALWLALFMVWGALRTLPFLDDYGMDALRDGVIWGYSLIAFCVAILVTPTTLDRLFSTYGRFIFPALVWLASIRFLAKVITMPTLPGAPVSIAEIKPGDVGVHLAGIGVFLFLRLDRAYGKPYPKAVLWFLWACWGLAWLMHGSQARAGMLSALVGLAVAFSLRPKLSGWVRPALLVWVLLLGPFLADSTGLLQIDSARRRTVSVEQIAANFTSLVGGPSTTDQESTVQWRLAWWKKIASYALDVQNSYFWMGKGFGINLANADGFPSPQGAPPNRHPHNITMNVLGRMGTPGLILWLLFLGSLGWRLLRATRRPGYTGRIAVWLLAYWLAFLFNAHTDVFLEGPMGGVWFWAVVGASWVFLYRVPREQAQLIPLAAPTTVMLAAAPASPG